MRGRYAQRVIGCRRVLGVRGRDGRGLDDRARGRRDEGLANLPIDALRLVVGTILLVFGLQWLRKAVLRASGLKALHDEEAIYEAEVALLRANGEQGAHDWYAFTVAFKGVFLEGLEVAFIVVTFGGTQRNVGLAAVGAVAAWVVGMIAGVDVHAPL